MGSPGSIRKMALPPAGSANPEAARRSIQRSFRRRSAPASPGWMKPDLTPPRSACRTPEMDTSGHDGAMTGTASAHLHFARPADTDTPLPHAVRRQDPPSGSGRSDPQVLLGWTSSALDSVPHAAQRGTGPPLQPLDVTDPSACGHHNFMGACHRPSITTSRRHPAEGSLFAQQPILLTSLVGS